MVAQIRLGSSILLEDFPYSVIGIDHYELIIFLSGKKSWDSFTISNQKVRKSFSITEGKTIVW